MIISQITSGLGNQLFQYAAARRLAEYHHTPFKLDLSWFNMQNFREYGLNHFQIIENIASNEEIEYAKQQNLIKEKHFHFNPEILQANPPLYLSGYWQSERYFKDIEAIIHQEFTIKYPLNEANQQIAEKIQNCEAVSIHIRRSDYLVNLNHGVCWLDYYDRAVDFISSMVTNAFFVVFSDDSQWVTNNLNLKYPNLLVSINNASTAYFDLYLMSLCKYHIIANSTFSWWGAWLSQKPGKIVIAPRRWFYALSHNTCDLIPESWTIM